MKVKNKKHIIKRIGLELLFFIIPVLIVLHYCFIFSTSKHTDKYMVMVFLVMFSLAYLIVQSFLGYWPKLTIDALCFNMKTDTFKVLWHEQMLFVDYAKNNPCKFYVERINGNKKMAFPAEAVTGCQPNDTIKIKYYRLSKVILSCELVKKVDSDLCVQENMVPDPNQK